MSIEFEIDAIIQDNFRVIECAILSEEEECEEEKMEGGLYSPVEKSRSQSMGVVPFDDCC